MESSRTKFKFISLSSSDDEEKQLNVALKMVRQTSLSAKQKYERQKELARNRKRRQLERKTKEQKEAKKKYDRERMAKLREEKKVKRIGDLTPREQRKMRKYWRERHRVQKMKKQSLEKMLENTPPNSPTPVENESAQRKSGRKQKCIPKILNTISLQGCAGFSFQEDTKKEHEGNLLHPECEIKEELSAEEEYHEQNDAIQENGHVSDSKKKDEEEQVKKREKRVKLTQLNTVEQVCGKNPKPSTSRRDDSYNVVDERKLALQESLFKTKELFDTFLRVCQGSVNSTDKENMEKVVQKLNREYERTRQEFLGSLKFQNILESETEKVNTSTAESWLNFKYVLDTMKTNKIKNHAISKLKLGESEESQDGGSTNEDEPVIDCPKKRMHLKKLEKFLRALNLKIKNLEEREVDLEDDDSAYIKLDRYRSQFTKCYNKICEIKGNMPDADRPYLRRVSFAGTKFRHGSTYPHINRCIERYYNKHREFPDFQDIKKLVIIANEQENIQMTPMQVQTMAEKAFKEFGEMLKRLRQYDDYDIIVSYLDQQVDPARDDPVLQEQLNKNALLFKKKEQEVMDKFVAVADGLHTESNEDSDSKPKKKKRKIMITAPKKKPLSMKKHLSSSDDSNNEENEEKSVKNKMPGPSFSSSSDSENEIEKTKKENMIKIEPTERKGKSLVGKKRLVKRGQNHSTPKKTTIPKPVISSSDDESVSKNPKNNFTNYLGLQVTPQTIETSNKEVNNEDEVMCVQEIQRSPPENNICMSRSAKNSSDSESSVEANHLPSVKAVEKPNSNSTYKNPKGPSIKSKFEVNTIDDSGSDSSSDLEPIAVVERTVNTIPKTEIKTEENPKRVEKRKSSDSVKKLILSSNSDESDSRTSDEDSDKKSASDVSDVDLSTGTKDLSSDSSDSEDEKKEKKASEDENDAIVILSEDVIEVTSPVVTSLNPNSNSQKSSDTEDDVCIVSQELSERRTVAPRRSKIEETLNNRNRPCPLSKKKVQKPLSSTITSTPAPRRRIVAATSIPVHKPTAGVKRRLPPQSNSNIQTKRSGSSSDTGSGSRQMTLPAIINGAARKTIISRVCRPKQSPESIPLIELD